MDVLPDTCGRRRVKHLLLMYLFVMKAAANCSKPQGRENIVLTNDALLMNTFPENVEVTLECANGYVKGSGSGVITCTDGNWTEPDLICNKKDCGVPPSQPHMRFEIPVDTLFGAEISAVCDKGYELSGQAYRQCFAHGWSGSAECEKVICEAPVEVPNGRVLRKSDDYPEYGDILQFECNEGYTLAGNETITCTETGDFDSDPPECRGVPTDGRITNMVTPTPTPTLTTTPPRPPTTEASTSAAATSTAHRDKTFTPSAAPTASPSPPGGRGILTAEERATPASVTSTTPFGDMREETADTSKDVGYTPVIVSVISVTIAALIFAAFLHKFLLRRKGSASGTEPICEQL